MQVNDINHDGLAIKWQASFTSSSSLHSHTHAAKRHPLPIRHSTSPTVQQELPNLPQKKHESRCESTGYRRWQRKQRVRTWYTSELGRLVLASFNMGNKIITTIRNSFHSFTIIHTRIKQMYKVFDTIMWQRILLCHKKDKPYNIWIPLEQKHNSSKAFKTEKKKKKI